MGSSGPIALQSSPLTLSSQVSQEIYGLPQFWSPLILSGVELKPLTTEIFIPTSN
jgi:hypothetical protein